MSLCLRTGLFHDVGDFAPRFVPGRHLLACLHASVVQHGPTFDFGDQLFLHGIVFAGPPPPSPFLSPRYGCVVCGSDAAYTRRVRSTVTRKPSRKVRFSVQFRSQTTRGPPVPGYTTAAAVAQAAAAVAAAARRWRRQRQRRRLRRRRRRRRPRSATTVDGGGGGGAAVALVRVRCVVPRLRLLRARQGAAQLAASPAAHPNAGAARGGPRVCCNDDGPDGGGGGVADDARATIAATAEPPADKIDCSGGRRQR